MSSSFGSKFLPLREVPYRMENHFYPIKCPPLNVTIFITHVCSLRNGRYDLAVDEYQRHSSDSWSLPLLFALNKVNSYCKKAYII